MDGSYALDTEPNFPSPLSNEQWFFMPKKDKDKAMVRKEAKSSVCLSLWRVKTKFGVRIATYIRDIRILGKHNA